MPRRIRLISACDIVPSHCSESNRKASSALTWRLGRRPAPDIRARRGRRNSVLKLLEYYCGPTEDGNEVTDAEYKEVEQDTVKQIPAPPVAPAELIAHDVTTQNRSEPVELATE
jgi:hypothetical protein